MKIPDICGNYGRFRGVCKRNPWTQFRLLPAFLVSSVILLLQIPIDEPWQAA